MVKLSYLILGAAFVALGAYIGYTLAVTDSVGVSFTTSKCVAPHIAICTQYNRGNTENTLVRIVYDY